jgi:hypothetical protein
MLTLMQQRRQLILGFNNPTPPAEVNYTSAAASSPSAGTGDKDQPSATAMETVSDSGDELASSKDPTRYEGVAQGVSLNW